jgi:hypothetical protein
MAAKTRHQKTPVFNRRQHLLDSVKTISIKHFDPSIADFLLLAMAPSRCRSLL